MKGKVLGIDNGGVVIIGQDGSRYVAALLEWKGQAPPKAGAEVDFVAAGSRAQEVYPLQSAFSIPSAESINTDAGRKALGVLRDRPQVIIAALALVASLFLNFVQINGGGDTPLWQSSAVGIPGKMATIRAAANDSIKATDSALSAGPDGVSGVGILAAISFGSVAEAKAKLDQAKATLALSQLVVLIFAIPAGAAAILFLEFRNNRNKLVELGTGVAGLLAVAAAFYAREATASYVSKMFGTGADTARQAFQLGLGGWLIGACGIGLVATALGYLRKTPGLPA